MTTLADDGLFRAPRTFMGAPYGRPGEGSRAAFIGLPFDCGVHPFRVGCRQGPHAVREMSALMRRYNPTYADFDPVKALGLVDCGDVELTPGRILDAYARMEAGVSAIVEAGAIPVTVGGDGSVSVPVLRAVAKRHPGLAVLHIDSHTDTYPYDDPDDRYNAATQLTHAVEEGLVDPHRSWHIGIRGSTFAQGVVKRARSLGYGVVSIDDLVRRGFAQTIAEFREGVARRPVYICFDMDVFDPSCAPGVATPTWGGLSAREGIDLIRTLTDLDIVAVDINTVSPAQDVNNMAAHLCAHVAYEFLVLLCRNLGLAED
ncbi:arginase family protein [Elioraea sp.]|uniref:arginase family protein n=1 Tax=Elioraea sp. TaxID=2185103 RepID=UPI0025C218B2|nr:arginase family protein [Elioraea sp.]